MKRELFRKAVRWFGALIAAHLVSMILFGIALSGSIAYMIVELPTRAKVIILIYNIVFDALFVLLCQKITSSDVSYRKSIRDAIKANTFSVIDYFKTDLLKEHLVKIGVFMAFQIPFVIFFAIFGLAVQLPTTFEEFYFMDAATYLITNSAIFGWILNTILFGIVFTLVRLLSLQHTKKELQQDIV